jgi:hypothetical protein
MKKIMCRLERIAKNKHLSLLGLFVSYEEEKVSYKDNKYGPCGLTLLGLLSTAF